jgi:hypothetical protein
MQSEHECRPEKTDRADDQQPMPAKPVHPLILGKLHFPASANFLPTESTGACEKKRLTFLQNAGSLTTIRGALVWNQVQLAKKAFHGAFEKGARVAEKRFERQHFRFTIALRCAGRAEFLSHLVRARKTRPNRRTRSRQAYLREQFAE